VSQTKIEWCDAVWNPTTGCSKVSEGCRYCYAERFAQRLAGRFGYPADDPFRVTLHPERLEEPLGWRKPRRVFVNSMGDLFHEDVPDEFICRVFAAIALTPVKHRFLILTKRPHRMREFILGLPQRDETFRLWVRAGGEWPLSNLWLGVTAENQQAADERIPILLEIPAAVRFVSVEPMLGPVDLGRLVWFKDGFSSPAFQEQMLGRRRLDWIVCGGETGPNARPCHPDWVRNLRDQCQAAGVPFFFKQWGQWNDLSSGNWIAPRKDTRVPWSDSYVLSHKNKIYEFLDGCRMFRMGKKTAGRLLDGQTWDEFPRQEVAG